MFLKPADIRVFLQPFSQFRLCDFRMVSIYSPSCPFDNHLSYRGSAQLPLASVVA